MDNFARYRLSRFLADPDLHCGGVTVQLLERWCYLRKRPCAGAATMSSTGSSEDSRSRRENSKATTS